MMMRRSRSRRMTITTICFPSNSLCFLSCLLVNFLSFDEKSGQGKQEEKGNRVEEGA